MNIHEDASKGIENFPVSMDDAVFTKGLDDFVVRLKYCRILFLIDQHFKILSPEIM